MSIGCLTTCNAHVYTHAHSRSHTIRNKAGKERLFLLVVMVVASNSMAEYVHQMRLLNAACSDCEACLPVLSTTGIQLQQCVLNS